ncbi:MAG: 1-acyl-sn-glycerol-3-phosphate acyltransferase [Bacteroidetes bacterium]|nr:1-acyl-sn-glycerol-3-phosphate acyltransferase [Bacteroidota bacterium]HET6245520.1 lysophospholipid acyltransferase family protein [Bacteroidia bacterium]
MNKITKVFQVCWKIYVIVNFCFSLLLIYPFFYWCFLNDKRLPRAFWIFQVWAKYITFSSAINVKITFEEELPSPPYVICPNHTSFLDIILAYSVFPDYFIFMGKQELGKIPIFKGFFKTMHILVDRKSKAASHRSFLQLGIKIDKGNCIIIFPEGTVSKIAPRLSPFKNGPFKLAIEKQVPLVPVSYLSNWKIFGNGSFWSSPCGPGTSTIYVHKAISTKDVNEKNMTQIKEQVYTVLDNKMAEFLEKEK